MIMTVNDNINTSNIIILSFGYTKFSHILTHTRTLLQMTIEATVQFFSHDSLRTKFGCLISVCFGRLPICIHKLYIFSSMTFAAIPKMSCSLA